MKISECIPMIPLDKKILKAYKPRWFSYKMYKSQNSTNGGVTRWGYTGGKEAKNTY